LDKSYETVFPNAKNATINSIRSVANKIRICLRENKTLLLSRLNIKKIIGQIFISEISEISTIGKNLYLLNISKYINNPIMTNKS
jgi:hypothetical protein